MTRCWPLVMNGRLYVGAKSERGADCANIGTSTVMGVLLRWMPEEDVVARRGLIGICTQPRVRDVGVARSVKNAKPLPVGFVITWTILYAGVGWKERGERESGEGGAT
jgi:hypothetical protein